MCNTIEVQKRVALVGAMQNLSHILERLTDEEIALVRANVEDAFDAGYLAQDEAPPIDDEALDELNREREAIASGCVEPPKLGWVKGL